MEPLKTETGHRDKNHFYSRRKMQFGTVEIYLRVQIQFYCSQCLVSLGFSRHFLLQGPKYDSICCMGWPLTKKCGLSIRINPSCHLM